MLPKHILMIPSTMNNHLQPKGRPTLYFSTMMGLESFLPVLLEKDGVSCSLPERVVVLHLHPLYQQKKIFPGHWRCTSSLRVLPNHHYSRSFLVQFFDTFQWSAHLTKFSFKAFPICLAQHGQEEKWIIKQYDTSFALLAIDGAFRQDSET